jgi:glycosyltransferase involved in cell wall biosynthesis
MSIAESAVSFTRYPNKVLNGAYRVFGAPRIEQLHSQDFDVLYMPNMDFVATKLPYVLTVHDLSPIHFPEYFSAKQRLWHRAVDLPTLAKNAAHIVAVSQTTKNDLVHALGVSESRVTVASLAPTFHGVPDAEARAAARKKYELPEKFILFFGTLETRKNVSGLVEAFSLLDSPGDYHLVLAGGHGHGFEIIARAIAASRHASRIHVLGYVPDRDRAALFAAASIFVYPSFFEGFSLPPLEAMSVGVPVVASDIPVHRENLGDTALLVNPYSVSELALALRTFIDEPDAAARFAEAGYKQASRFSWRECARAVHRAFCCAAGRE